jgi:hypothetical protein
MKFRLFVVFLALSTLARAQGNAPRISTRMSGAFANSTFTINGHSVNLAVSTIADQEQMLLNYNYSLRNPDGSSTFAFGFGYIPNDTVTINNANVAKLNVDTSQVAGFTSTSCTFTPGIPGTCTSGPFGVIQIEWHQDGVMSNRTVSENWRTFPGARVHTSDNNDTNSASVTGTFLGSDFYSDLGDIGTNKNSLFEMFDN